MKLDLGNYRCAIFDLDGTLLDSTWVWEKIDIDFLAKRGIAVPADYMQEIRNHNFITGSKYVIERFHLNENAEDIAAEWHEMAQEQYDNVITLKPGAGAFLRTYVSDSIFIYIFKNIKGTGHEIDGGNLVYAYAV